jgi:hypothetical protein
MGRSSFFFILPMVVASCTGNRAEYELCGNVNVEFLVRTSLKVQPVFPKQQKEPSTFLPIFFFSFMFALPSFMSFSFLFTKHPPHPLSAHHEPKRMTIREALESKTLENETLAYYLARTWQFCDSLGFNLEKVRFRQHLDNEMVPFFPPSSHLTLNTSQKGTLRPRLLGSRNQNNIRLG